MTVDWIYKCSRKRQYDLCFNKCGVNGVYGKKRPNVFINQPFFTDVGPSPSVIEATKTEILSQAIFLVLEP